MSNQEKHWLLFNQLLLRINIISIDRQGHVWYLHMPQSLGGKTKGEDSCNKLYTGKSELQKERISSLKMELRMT